MRGSYEIREVLVVRLVPSGQPVSDIVVLATRDSGFYNRLRYDSCRLSRCVCVWNLISHDKDMRRYLNCCFHSSSLVVSLFFFLRLPALSTIVRIEITWQNKGKKMWNGVDVERERCCHTGIENSACPCPAQGPQHPTRDMITTNAFRRLLSGGL